jgi:class 3 adenylate cyclase
MGAGGVHLEDMQVSLVRVDQMLRAEIDASGGYLFESGIDTFGAAFHDAPAALGAALGIQTAMSSECWPEVTPVRLRIALHSGRCEERAGAYFGPVVNRGAALEAVASGGQIVVSGRTAELLEQRLPTDVSMVDLGEHRLRDLGHPEQVFEVYRQGLAERFGPLRSLNNPRLLHNLSEHVSSFV